MLIIPAFIGWLAGLVGVIGITPFTPGWIGCALACGVLGLLLWPGLAIISMFDEFVLWSWLLGVAGSVVSGGLLLAAIAVPFWRGLGIHEVIIR